jgi:hypothetical protein
VAIPDLASTEIRTPGSDIAQTELQNVYDAAGNIVGTYPTTITTPGSATSLTELRNVYDAAGNIVGTYSARLNTPGYDPTKSNLKDISARAERVDGKYVAQLSTSGYPFVQDQLQTLMDMQFQLEHGSPPASTSGASQKVKKKAAGGPIRGRGSGTSDDVPIWASNGEFVQPTHAVEHYGAGFMEAIRQHAIPRFVTEAMGYAKGGKVAKWPYPADVSKTQIPLMGILGDTPSAAFAVASAMKASARVLLALFETGIVESGMKNLASRKVKESLKYPHEGVAPGNLDSVGFLQQRAGWGSVKSRMNVADSTRRFVKNAQGKEERRGSAGDLAQAVQVSANPSAYDAVEGRAKEMLGLAKLGGDGTAAGSAGAPFTPGYKNQIATINKAGFNFHPSVGQTYGGGHAKNSWHYKGRAIDLSPPTDKAWNWLVANYAKTSKELFWRSKNPNYRHGQAVGPMDKTNHIHWAYAQGGLVSLPKNVRGFLEAEEEAVVQKAVSGKGLSSRENEILRELSQFEVNNLSRLLPADQFNKLRGRFNGAQRRGLEVTVQVTRRSEASRGCRGVRCGVR